MAYAIVSTVNPNAKLTPSRPMPTFGNAAARTALPHPPKTSQNVPMNSAIALLPKDITFLSLIKPTISQRHRPPFYVPDPSPRHCPNRAIAPFYGYRLVLRRGDV